MKGNIAAMINMAILNASRRKPVFTQQPIDRLAIFGQCIYGVMLRKKQAVNILGSGGAIILPCTAGSRFCSSIACRSCS